MGQAPVLQRVRGADHRGVADVARVRHQQRGDRHVQVLQPRLATGNRRERLVGTGPREHLQQYLGQVDPGQHRLHRFPQVTQGRRFGLRLQGGEVQPSVVVEHDLGIRRHPPGDLTVGAIQQRGPRRKVLARLCRQVERGQHGGPGLLPRRSVQQLCPRVTPLGGVLREHLLAPQHPVQLLQHAERIRLPVHRARLQVRRRQHEAPPRTGEQTGVDLSRTDLLGPVLPKLPRSDK